jgi:xanthine dehydrogenase YagT iron-sulfur-binding subunit
MNNDENVHNSLTASSPDDVTSPSRRQFMQQLSGITATSLVSPTAAVASTVAVLTDSAPKANPMLAPVKLQINNKAYSLTLDSRVTLLDALREYAGLMGTKKGCDHGACGACTVLVNGRRINACLTLAVMHQMDQVTTIEGLTSTEGSPADGTARLHPVQEAFLKHDGFQCGYCTPGQIMSAVALVKEGHTRSEEEIREWMSGNICRCGAYNNIVEAIKAVRTLD